MRASALAFLIIASSASASTAPTALTGRVVSGGAPANGVTVTATSKALQRERSTITNREGRYWLPALPPGNYEVTFSRAGLQTLTKRAVVELGRVARADATLEPSEDEESITSTALTVGVADTLSVTSHYSDEILDRLPLPRRLFVPAIISPSFLDFGPAYLDDTQLLFGSSVNEEALEQVTLIRASAPVELPAVVPFIHGRTRSGGEEFSFALRDTITSTSWIAREPSSYENDTHHLFEGAAGGRIVPRTLWFFASAWRGSEVFQDDQGGAQAKLTAQLGAQHNLAALYRRTTFETEHSSLRYTGTAGPRFTTEAVVARSGSDAQTAFVKTTYVAGRHVLSAGGDVDSSALFVSDRLLLDRWTVNAGLRHEFDRLAPRGAVSYDLRGDGRHAVMATAGDYHSDELRVRELTLGYATAIGNTGSARVDVIRRDRGRFAMEGLQADFVYTLFDRFRTGGSYTAMRMRPGGGSRFPEHAANVWASVDFPLGSHEVGVTVLEILRTRVDQSIPAVVQTELALRYTIPIARTHATLAADVSNLFNRRHADYVIGRAVRGWVRVRMLP